MIDHIECVKPIEENCKRCTVPYCKLSPIVQAETHLPSAGLDGSIALLPSGEIARDELIRACRDAGFDQRQWKAMTFEHGPYDISCPTVQLKNLVKILTGRTVNTD